jgi:hypothetical protein
MDDSDQRARLSHANQTLADWLTNVEELLAVLEARRLPAGSHVLGEDGVWYYTPTDSSVPPESVAELLRGVEAAGLIDNAAMQKIKRGARDRRGKQLYARLTRTCDRLEMLRVEYGVTS